MYQSKQFNLIIYSENVLLPTLPNSSLMRKVCAAHKLQLSLLKLKPMLDAPNKN